MKLTESLLLLFIITLPYISSQDKQSHSNILSKLNSLRNKTLPFPTIPDILDKYYYNRTDILIVTVKGLHTFRQRIPYDYSYLNLCQINLDTPPEGISELLTGKKSSFTNFIFAMNVNETCAISCLKKFTTEEIERFKWLIDRHYSVTYYLDKLPSGYKNSYFDRRRNRTMNFTNYNMGIPIGYKKNDTYYLFNHLTFYVEINKKNDQYQVVDFYVSAHSAEQSDSKKCYDADGIFIYQNENETDKGEEKEMKMPDNITVKQIKDFSKQNEYPDYIDDILGSGKKRYYEIAEKEQELNSNKIAFTYDVIFIQSNKTFSSRFDHYFTTRRGFRWLSLFYSNLIIFALTLIIFCILRRTVNKDLTDYNKKVKVMQNNDVIIDEFGWKQINGDVFRRPKKLMFLSAFVGTGIEILCLFIVALILSIIGFLKPESRGNIINSIMYSFIFMSIVAGYFSTYIYKNNGGEQWLLNTVFTALFFPAISISVIAVSRILLTFEQSSASFKISQIGMLILLWLFISSPLVYCGSMLCMMRPKKKAPCKVNKLPTTIGKKPWYLHLQYAAWFTGLIPFATIFIEFLYIMSYMWRYPVYFMASFLSLSVLFEVIISSEISIIFVFVNLCKGDYNWWWKSFFVSASPALYILLFSIFYFFRLALTRFTAIVIYFLIMSLITLACALLCGACGTFITSWFVYYIYSKIKVD